MMQDLGEVRLTFTIEILQFILICVGPPGPLLAKLRATKAKATMAASPATIRPLRLVKSVCLELRGKLELPIRDLGRVHADFIGS